ncbi:hypothetical protein YIM_20405 [Amycolatopsis sp. YIM 10]|nr:hypothetical protein YIM_20405 [Amycolatopsis sp. YIM 10]
MLTWITVFVLVVAGIGAILPLRRERPRERR